MSWTDTASNTASLAIISTATALLRIYSAISSAVFARLPVVFVFKTFHKALTASLFVAPLSSNE